MPAVMMKASPTRQDTLGIQQPSGGDVFTWGWDALAQLGHDKERSVGRVHQLTHHVITAVACGRNHTMALTSDSQVYSWGCLLDGRLGHTASANPEPELVSGLPTVGDVGRVCSVACGDQHSVAVTTQGSLYVWGSGPQLGLGADVMLMYQPACIRDGLDGIKVSSVCCGSTYTLAVTVSGTVLSWGSSKQGGLGHGHMEQVLNIPTRIPRLEAIKAVFSGGDHNLAIDSAGSLFSWGLGESGQLGHRRQASLSYPLSVSSLQRVTCTTAACGYWHSLVSTSAGDVYSFGSGVGGRLGLGNDENQTVPLKIDFDWHVTQLAAGARHSVALTENNDIYVWGSGPDNELGLIPGKTDHWIGHEVGKELDKSFNKFSSMQPTLIYSAGALVSNTIFQIAAGNHHTVVLADKSCQLRLNVTLHNRRDQLEMNLELSKWSSNRLAKSITLLQGKLVTDQEQWDADSAQLEEDIKEQEAERWWLHENNGALFDMWKRTNNKVRKLDELIAAQFLGNGVITNSIIRFTHRDLLVYGFCHFANNVRSRVQLRAQRYLALLGRKPLFQDLMEAHLAYCCEHWRQVVWINLRDERLMVAIRVLQQMILKPAFVAWESSIRYEGVIDPRLAYIARRWRRLPLAVGFREWKLYTQEIQRQRRVMIRATRRWRQQELTKALNTFVDWYRERLRLLSAMNRSLSKWKNRELSKAWNRWRDAYERSKQFLKFLKGVIRRMMKIELSRAWESWQAWYEFQCRQQDLVNRAMRRWQNRELAKGWISWMAWYDDLMRQRAALNRSLRKWKNRELSKAWVSWLDWMSEQARLKELLSRSMTKWVHNAQSRALNSWRAWYLDCMEQRRKVNNALRRWKYRELSSALNRWFEYLEELKESWRVLNKGLRSWMHRELKRGLNSWIEWLDAYRQQQAKVRKALRRWIQRELSKGLMTWIHWYCDLLEQRRKVKAAISRWIKRELSRALNAWVEWYKEILRQRRMLLGAINRLNNLKLSRAWESLQDFPHWIRRMKHYLASIARQWQHIWQVKGMRTWKYWTFAEQQRRRQLEQKKRLLLSTREHSDDKNALVIIHHDLEEELARERELLANAQKQLGIEQQNLEEELEQKELLTQRLAACIKPEGHENDSWEELYLAAKHRRVSEVAKLRGMYLFSVMKHLQGDMWGRAFRAWAHGSLDPRELLLLQLSDLHTREKKMVDVLLRPVWKGFDDIKPAPSF